jgi:AraC-like DNA-binding protein
MQFYILFSNHCNMSIEVKYHEPPADLSWLVKQFESIDFAGDCVIHDKFIPREDISLVFHFGIPPLMLLPVRKLLPPFFIAPVISRANQMRLDQPNRTFIITCKPTVFSRIFGITLTTGEYLYVSLPEQPFSRLWEQLMETSTDEECIQHFSRFLKSFHQHKYVPDIIDQVYDQIIHTGSFTSLHDILGPFNVSERTIQRKFRLRVGVSPKKLIRIKRINTLWTKIKEGQSIDYQDLVYLGNYFDQAHFIKDFKAITGETPDKFFHRDLQLVKILSGKSGFFQPE